MLVSQLFATCLTPLFCRESWKEAEKGALSNPYLRHQLAVAWGNTSFKDCSKLHRVLFQSPAGPASWVKRFFRVTNPPNCGECKFATVENWTVCIWKKEKQGETQEAATGMVTFTPIGKTQWKHFTGLEIYPVSYFEPYLSIYWISSPFMSMTWLSLNGLLGKK